MDFIDTHAHIHFDDYQLDADEVWESAKKNGVTKMLVVGCDEKSSVGAVEFAKRHEGVYPVVGVHPHYATRFLALNKPVERLDAMINDSVVAIGEFGLDYHYENSKKADQVELLRMHLELCQKYDLPACFHVRDAFDDFWPVFDEFNAKKQIRGVLHSFTDSTANLQKALKYGLFIALNGIMTFSDREEQLEVAKKVPLSRLLLETDAPYLTPKPFRGTICKPEYVILTAEFLAGHRGDKLMTISEATTKNAIKLFGI